MDDDSVASERTDDFSALADEFRALAEGGLRQETACQQQEPVRVRFHIIRNARIEYVGIYQSCMVSKLRII